MRLRKGFVTEVDGSAGALDLYRAQIAAAAAVLEPGTYFGHESAAVLHGLPLLNSRLGEVVVLRTRGGHGNITSTLHARRAALGIAEVTTVCGLPVTSLARTVADLVKRLPFPEAVMVADAGLRAGAGRVELAAYAVSGRGCRMAARALSFADGRAESAGESLSRVRIHQAGLPAPELQHEFVNRWGAMIGRLDFWWPWCGVAGEFDGMVKYGELLRPGQTVKDVIRHEKQREQRLVDEGIRVIRWTWADLWNRQLAVRLGRVLTRPSGEGSP